MVAKIDNKIDQAHFIYSISSKTGIPEDSLREELVKIKNNVRNSSEKFVQNNEKILNPSSRAKLTTGQVKKQKERQKNYPELIL